MRFLRQLRKHIRQTATNATSATTAKRKRIKMTVPHRFILEPYRGMNSRHICPSCQQRDKTFSLYIDTATGQPIHPTVGRCNRESKCGYHYTPKQYFQDNSISFDTVQQYKPRPIAAKPKPVSFIRVEDFKASLVAHEDNYFVSFLVSVFGLQIASELISRYFIGTSKHWKGATVFWQIDTRGRIRTGKIMLYNPKTGKRVKEPSNCITWVHKALKMPEYELKQCFFGEHLINHDKFKPLAIVESEKTAIIASVYLPQFIWLAVGSINNLSAQRCMILKGRTVRLFPDLKGFEKWNDKAKQLSKIADFTVSDLLERKASEAERKDGLDLADYLLKFDFREFQQQETKKAEAPKVLSPVYQLQRIEQPKPTFFYNRSFETKPENWEQDISELETFFDGFNLPAGPYKLNSYSEITEIKTFIDSHITTVKANNGKRSFCPFLDRLKELKHSLTLNIK